MNVFQGYDEAYPNLVVEIINYFSSNNIGETTVLKFCTEYAKSMGEPIDGVVKPDPFIVDFICEILCSKRMLSVINKSTTIPYSNSYFTKIKDKKDWEKNQGINIHYYNSIVYGTQYIYKTLKEEVNPLIYEMDNGDLTIGTCFRVGNNIITAKHCLIGARSIAIKGYNKKDLENSVIYMCEDNKYDLDLALISLVNPAKDKNHITLSECQVLEDILVFGYPQLPGFMNFLIAEPANISSKEKFQLVSTKGKVVGKDKATITNTELMLITAKIKGGNSGGPVVNMKGQIVGVVSNSIVVSEEFTQGNYDDLGYGLCVPINYIYKIITDKCIFSGKINFIDFKE